MRKQIVALKLALEALEWNLPVVEDWGGEGAVNLQHKAINAIREALAQPEQELVKAIHIGFDWLYNKQLVATYAVPVATNLYAPDLYTTPPHRKPLTDEMKKQMRESCDSHEMRGAFVDGWLSAEAAHGIWPENSDCYGPDWTDRDGEYLK